MPTAWLSKVAKEWGIFCAMSIFFIWWGYGRENALNAKVDAQDTFIRETLVTTIQQNTKAFENFSAALARRDRQQEQP